MTSHTHHDVLVKSMLSFVIPLRWLMASLISASLLTFPQVAWGHRPGLNNLDHVIDQEVFEALHERLALSEAQLVSANAHFDAYFASVKQLDDASQHQYDELQRRSEAISGGASADITTEAISIRAESNRTADLLLNTFYLQLEEILSEQQRQAMPAVKRLVRRMNWLGGDEHPNRARFTRYVDLVALYETATLKGAELESGVLDESAQADIQAALSEYEIAIDDRFAKAEGLLRVAEHIAPGEKPTAFSEKERRAWRCGVYSLTSDAATRIAAAVDEAGLADASRQWELRFWRSCDDSLFRETPIERLQSAIVEKNIALSPEQSAAVDAIIIPYEIQLHGRRREVFASAIKAMCALDDIIGDEPAQANVAQSILRLLELYGTTIQQLNGVLAPLEVAEITDDREPDEFRSSYLSFLTLHMRIELGFEDPTTLKSIRFNQDTGETEIWRPQRDPVTGKWVLMFDSIMPDR